MSCQPNFSAEAISYFQDENLGRYFAYESQRKVRGVFDAVDSNCMEAIPPDIEDLVRLHRLIRSRRILTVLEFGVGYSTVVIADALMKNKAEIGREVYARNIRCSTPFRLFSVDADEGWISKAKSRIPQSLVDILDISYSSVQIGIHDGQLCHFYKNVPDVIPDFIYLDGPAPFQVEGVVNGLSFKNCRDRTVMSGDLLLMEPTFLPGTCILVDGRTNNARFLENNFRRNWSVLHNEDEDFTLFELLEPPLGKYDKNRLEFCLGSKFFDQVTGGVDSGNL